MKKFAIQTFLFGCGLMLILVSIICFMVRFGYLTFADLSSLSGSFLFAQGLVDVLLLSAACFMAAGVLLMGGVLGGLSLSKAIVIKEKGEVIRIPIKTIKEFIGQTIDHDKSIIDPRIFIKKNGATKLFGKRVATPFIRPCKLYINSIYYNFTSNPVKCQYYFMYY